MGTERACGRVLPVSELYASHSWAHARRLTYPHPPAVAHCLLPILAHSLEGCQALPLSIVALSLDLPEIDFPLELTPLSVPTLLHLAFLGKNRHSSSALLCSRRCGGLLSSKVLRQDDLFSPRRALEGEVIQSRLIG